MGSEMCIRDRFFDDDEDCQGQANSIEKWIAEEPELKSNLKLLKDYELLMCTTSNLLIRFRRIEIESSTVLKLCFYLCDDMAFANLIAHISEFLCLQAGGTSNLKAFLDTNEVSKKIKSIEFD